MKRFIFSILSVMCVCLIIPANYAQASNPLTDGTCQAEGSCGAHATWDDDIEAFRCEFGNGVDENGNQYTCD